MTSLNTYNPLVSRPARERLDFEPRTITRRVHRALDIETSCPIQGDCPMRDGVIAKMRDYCEKLFSGIEDTSYKSDPSFIKMQEDVKIAKSLQDIMKSVIDATQKYYDSIFPWTDRLESFFDGDFDSNGGFLNSIRLQASFFKLSVNKLFEKLPSIGDFGLENLTRILTRMQKLNSEFIESLATMHIGVLKKLYNLLGEKFKTMTRKPYNFKSKHFDLDSKLIPTRLLPKKSLVEDLIKSIKRAPYFAQTGKNHDVNLDESAPGCPAFLVQDSSGKPLPKVVADWFQEIVEDYVYPELPRLFKISPS